MDLVILSLSPIEVSKDSLKISIEYHDILDILWVDINSSKSLINEVGPAAASRSLNMLKII